MERMFSQTTKKIIPDANFSGDGFGGVDLGLLLLAVRSYQRMGIDGSAHANTASAEAMQSS